MKVWLYKGLGDIAQTLYLCNVQLLLVLNDYPKMLAKSNFQPDNYLPIYSCKFLLRKIKIFFKKHALLA